VSWIDSAARHRIAAAALALCALAVLLAAAARAEARPAGEGRDGRPNILVIMTDDMATADVAQMPNVKRLLAKKGTTFADAVDSFPLCCPSRATFLTGQYAHNHGVAGNFYPYGWYGMTNRKNTLPSWLDKAGYTTALVGKWLNGYGAVDGHGEVPAGFDIWRGLLDVSAYDYYNFVMNIDGNLRSWGDADFARKLVEFADIQVTPPDSKSVVDILNRLQAVMGPPPYTYWGAENPREYSPDVTGGITTKLLRAERRSKKPFFIWWTPAAPHREDVATTLMGRPGPDPRPPKRYEGLSRGFEMPQPPSFNEADLSDKPSNLTSTAPLLSDAEIEQLKLDYQGRIGSLRAVDDHVAKMVRALKRTGQLRNTLIVFTSDNGWLHGQHRVGGDKFLPYEESVRIPLILRGPGVPKGKRIRGSVGNVDFAPTLLDAADVKAGRRTDGVSLWPTIRKPKSRPDRALLLEATYPLFKGPIPINAWDRPYKGVRTERFTFVVWPETGERELYDRRRDPFQLQNVIADPAYATVVARLAAKLTRLEGCRGKSCSVKP
jgi:arylsulfatase A-like enzyme